MILFYDDGLFNKPGMRPQTGMMTFWKGHYAKWLQTTGTVDDKITAQSNASKKCQWAIKSAESTSYVNKNK